MQNWTSALVRLASAICGVALCVTLGAANLHAQGEQVFKGQITRCMCSDIGAGGAPGAAGARTGTPGALPACSMTCAKSGAKYVLRDAKANAVYLLSNQRKSKAFAGQYVIVMGSLDKATDTIEVDNMVRGLPPEVAQAKAVFIYCDACPRGMAKAKLAALEALASWNRFDLVDDPAKANLVFIFSANPYLGDYITRDGPDKRPVSVDITYMNVVDPHTGANLWGDYRQWGSWRVASATKSLIAEFREQLDEENAVDQQSVPGKHGDHNSSPILSN